MRKILLTLVVLLMLGGIGIALLIANLDAERFRPTLIELARSQADLELAIDGDLGIALWPDIALEVQDVSARWVGDTHEEPLLRAGSVRLQAALWPLLSLTPALQVREIELTSTRINLAVDAAGADNWTPPGASIPPPEPEQADGSGLALEVQRISIVDAAVAYSDARDGTRARLEQFDMTLATAAEGELLPLRMSGRGELEQTATAEFSGSARLGLGDTLSLADLRFDVALRTPELQSPLQLALSGAISLIAGERLQLDALGLRIGALDAVLDGSILLSAEAPELALRLRMPRADPRPLLRQFDALPAFVDPAALSSLALETRISSAGDQYRLEALQAQLDETTLSGSLTAALGGAVPELGFELRGDVLNLDRYSTAVVTQTDTGPIVDDEPLPLEGLDSAAWDGQLQLSRLVSGSIDVGPITLRTSNAGTRLRLTVDAADVFSGTVQAEVALDRTAPQPAWSLQLDSSGLRAEDLAPAAGFIGPLGMAGRLGARGASSAAITDSLTGSLELDGASGSLDVSGLKAGLLTVARLLGHGERIAAWPDRMQYQALGGRLQFGKGVGDQQLVLAVDNLQLDAVGGLDLRSERFDYRVAATFVDRSPRTFDVNADLLGVRWPLRCRAGFADGGSPCGLDADSARVLVTQLMTNRALNPVREQIEDKLPDGAKQLLRGLFGTPPQQ